MIAYRRRSNVRQLRRCRLDLALHNRFLVRKCRHDFQHGFATNRDQPLADDNQKAGARLLPGFKHAMQLIFNIHGVQRQFQRRLGDSHTAVTLGTGINALAM